MGYYDEDSCFRDVGILKELIEEQKEKDFDKKRKELDEALELARERSKSDQTAKADSGKPQLTLVPRQIIFDIAKVREYGVKKYEDPDNWKRVSVERYRDAAFRHFMAYLDDPYGLDEESGLPHLAHLACNVAFLCELQKDLYDEVDDISDSPSLSSQEEEAIDLELERIRRKTND